jgi:hypothetical protein
MMSARVSFVGSEFQNVGRAGQELARGYTQAVTARLDAAAAAGAGWTIEGGAIGEHRRTNEIAREYRGLGNDVSVRAERDRSPRVRLSGGWVHVSRPGGGFGLAAGVRVTARTSADGLALSPWALVERRAGGWTWRAGAGAASQFPDARLVLRSTEPMRPERAHGVDAGVSRDLAGGLRWEVSAFARRESDVVQRLGEERLDPVSGARIVESRFPLFTQAIEGTSHGLEIVLMRRGRPGPTGWASYTYAKTRRRDRATGESFDADADQRHTLNASWDMPLSPRSRAGASLRVGSNVPLAGYFEETEGGMRLSVWRNRVRLPVYARLDLRASRSFAVRHGTFTLVLEVMNALGRRNVGRADPSARSTGIVTGYAERLIPRVPSLGLVVDF